MTFSRIDVKQTNYDMSYADQIGELWYGHRPTPRYGYGRQRLAHESRARPVFAKYTCSQIRQRVLNVLARTAVHVILSEATWHGEALRSRQNLLSGNRLWH